MSRRTTQLSVAQARADLVAEWVARYPERVRTIDDVRDMPEVSGWDPAILDAAIDRLIAEGRLVEDAIGVLLVKPRGPIR